MPSILPCCKDAIMWGFDIGWKVRTNERRKKKNSTHIGQVRSFLVPSRFASSFTNQQSVGRSWWSRYVDLRLARSTQNERPTARSRRMHHAHGHNDERRSLSVSGRAKLKFTLVWEVIMTTVNHLITTWNISVIVNPSSPKRLLNNITKEWSLSEGRVMLNIGVNIMLWRWV